jgi:hypothetical protein
MSYFVGKPQRDQLRIEPEPTGFRIRYTREMFEADKGVCFPANYKLACIRCSDTHHQHDIDVGIDLEKIAALIFSVSSESDDIHPLEHRAKISPSCESS